MSGYEKVSFLKFEAAGESWYVTDWNDRVACVEHEYDDTSVCCVSLVDWSVTQGGTSVLSSEKSAIVEYLRANPLPGDGE